jgi:hypothetical protein
MIKLLVKLYIQLEKLWANPAAWFGHQPWIIRLLVISLIIPLITLSSVTWYNGLNQSQKRAQELQLQSYDEFKTFKEVYDKNTLQQLEELKTLKKDIAELKKDALIREIEAEASTDVLGVQTLTATENSSSSGTTLK